MTMSSSSPPAKLLTIILASNRPETMSQLFFNLQDMCDDPSCFEVLVKIDEGDEKMRHCLELAVDMYPFEIRYLQTPREDGYYTLHHGYQELWKIANPETYFILALSDEVRIKTKGWDTLLKRYVGFFPDHLFRLKISVQKYRNYYYAYDCGPSPENFSIMSRRWMELTEGIGDCWGPDAWHQNIDYHLGLMQEITAFRSVPVYDIAIGGEEAGLMLSEEQSLKRSVRIYQEWWRLISYPVQQEVRRLAVKMYAYIWAHHFALQRFVIIEDKKHKLFAIESMDEEGARKQEAAFFYHLSRGHVFLMRMLQLMRYYRRRSGFDLQVLRTYVVASSEPKSLFKYVQRSMSFLMVCAAFPLSFLPHSEFKAADPWRRLRLRFMAYEYILRSIRIRKKYRSIDQLAAFQELNAAFRKRIFALGLGGEAELAAMRKNVVYHGVSPVPAVWCKKEKVHELL